MDEPVLVLNLLNMAIGAAVAFGTEITMEQKAAIIAVTTAVLNIIARNKVTPNRKIDS